MKLIFRRLFVIIIAFLIQKNAFAKKTNTVVNKASVIQHRIFKEYNERHEVPNKLIHHINQHHNLDKIETEVSDKLAESNWLNWYNWNNWDNWNWFNWDNWDNWATWDNWSTWDNWYTWDNWSNWFSWSNW